MARKRTRRDCRYAREFLIESAMLQIHRMKNLLAGFKETIESSQRHLNSAYETLKYVSAGELEQKDRFHAWPETDRKRPVLRPDEEKLALQLREHAKNVHGHKAKQLFLAMAEEYERLAGKPEDRNKLIT